VATRRDDVRKMGEESEINVTYAVIADWTAEEPYPVTFMCDQFGVVRQGYYRWLANGSCQRERTDAQLTQTSRETSRVDLVIVRNPGSTRVP
jgi:hypothetical protein